jgi:hypothetical protein
MFLGHLVIFYLNSALAKNLYVVPIHIHSVTSGHEVLQDVETLKGLSRQFSLAHSKVGGRQLEEEPLTAVKFSVAFPIFNLINMDAFCDENVQEIPIMSRHT